MQSKKTTSKEKIIMFTMIGLLILLLISALIALLFVKPKKPVVTPVAYTATTTFDSKPIDRATKKIGEINTNPAKELPKFVLKNSQGTTNYRHQHSFLFDEGKLLIQTDNALWYIDLMNERSVEFPISTSLFTQVQISDKYIVWTEEGRTSRINYVTLAHPAQEAKNIMLANQDVTGLNIQEDTLYLQGKTGISAFDLQQNKQIKNDQTQMTQTAVFQGTDAQNLAISKKVAFDKSGQLVTVKKQAEKLILAHINFQPRNNRKVNLANTQERNAQFLPLYAGNYLLQTFFDINSKKQATASAFYLTDTKKNKTAPLNDDQLAKSIPIAYNQSSFLTKNLEEQHQYDFCYVAKTGAITKQPLQIPVDSKVVDVLLSQDGKIVFIAEVTENKPGAAEKHIELFVGK